MSKIWDNYIDKHDTHKRALKKQIRKEANIKMCGPTKLERFKNFFLNRTGYYSWKEMTSNWLIIIFSVMTLIAFIVCMCRIKKMSIMTLANDPGFMCITFALAFLVVFLFTKRKQRKNRFECFLNNGNSDKYVFWKDDLTNPINKTKRGFK